MGGLNILYKNKIGKCIVSNNIYNGKKNYAYNLKNIGFGKCIYGNSIYSGKKYACNLEPFT